ncbi:hypothetical protein ABH931_005948, partial [Streptacidiphilus sp. MAP12-33]|uniref:hypothetical protein n=1 Tax=Streptacidiphilus sp. MAP12-33 TaxID=3156266 RepID=UPI0035158D45
MGISLRGGVRRAALTGLASLSLVGAAAVGLAPQAGAATAPTANPYSPAYGHSYRHGAIPTVAQNAKMSEWAA